MTARTVTIELGATPTFVAWARARVPIDLCRRYPWLCPAPGAERVAAPEAGHAHHHGAPAQGLFGVCAAEMTVDLGAPGLLDTLSREEIADLFYTLGLADGARGGCAAAGVEALPAAPTGRGEGGAERA